MHIVQIKDFAPAWATRALQKRENKADTAYIDNTDSRFVLECKAMKVILASVYESAAVARQVIARLLAKKVIASIQHTFMS